MFTKQKIKTIFIIIFAANLLSGCSLAPQKPAEGDAAAPKEYKFSESIWKSSDGSVSWAAKNISRNKLKTSDLAVLQIAADPFNSDIVYVGLRSGGVIKTTDGGESWEQTNIIADRIYGFEIDPEDSRVLYVSGQWEGRGKIWKSEDSGETWKEIYTKSANGPLVVSLALNSRRPKEIFATTGDNIILKSEDGGDTWRNIFQPRSPALKVAIDREDADLVYILVRGGTVFRSEDGGDNFSEMTQSLDRRQFSNRNFSILETDPSNSGWIYLAGDGGIARSKDAGNTWERVVILDNLKDSPVTALAINPANSREIMYGSALASYKSVDGGGSWSTSQFDTAGRINIIKYDPLKTSNIYIGFIK